MFLQRILLFIKFSSIFICQLKTVHLVLSFSRTSNIQQIGQLIGGELYLQLLLIEGATIVIIQSNKYTLASLIIRYKKMTSLEYKKTFHLN